MTCKEPVVELGYVSLAYPIMIFGFHLLFREGHSSLCLQVLTVLCNVVEKGPAYCRRLWPGPLLSCLLNTLALSDTEVVGQSLELLQLLFLHQPEVGLVCSLLLRGHHSALLFYLYLFLWARLAYVG